MPTLINTLTSYVPTLITRRLVVDPTPIQLPMSEQFSGAILFADIAGFTALTERLSQQGPHGVELLAQLLNTYFDQVINLISAYGGDVVKFAGDSLIAYWPTTDQPHLGYPQAFEATTAMRYATQCAALIQQQLKDYESLGTPLRLRTSLGIGSMIAMHLGGVFDRAELIMLGHPITQIKLADQDCSVGQVALSPEAWAYVQPYAQATQVSEAAWQLQHIDLALPMPTPTQFPQLSKEAQKALQPYIPAAIFSRLTAGQTQWLAELSTVTTIFINLPDLTPKTTLGEAQMVMSELQHALYRYEGSINKVNVDEKGITLVAVLGVPPLIHSDDAARGVRATLDIQAKLQAMGRAGAIGITTGRAFCGTIGSAVRCEYTMHGDVINLSARLMQTAHKFNDSASYTVPILCDEATYRAAEKHALFEQLPQVMVKGKEQSVKVYRPLTHIKRYYRSRTLTGLLSSTVGAATKSVDDLRARTDMIGQTHERHYLQKQLQGVLQDYTFQAKQPRVVIIEGSAGIGKSRLMADLIEQAYRLKVTYWVGAANALERYTPYHAWFSVFNQLFKLDMLPNDPKMHLKYILSQLVADFGLSKMEVAELLLLAPLLKAVIPLDLPENELTLAMPHEARAQNTRHLLFSLIMAVTRQNPTALILEDAHGFDSASWALAEMVIESQTSLLLVITSRPNEETHLPLLQINITNPFLLPRAEFLNFVARKGLAAPRRLQPLSMKETLQLVKQRLGVQQLSSELQHIILAKAEGHPFFSEELAYMLRDLGVIKTSQGQGELVAPISVPLPDTVEAVIASRLNVLLEPHQLALKVASVMGRIFQFQTLLDIYPIGADKAQLPQIIHQLTELDLLSLETPFPELAYIFKHTITQEVVYQRMVKSQRQKLHQAVAEWYEQTQAHNLTPFYPLLAYHWGQAQVILKEVYYLEQTAQQALANGAYQEAVEYFQQLLTLVQSSHLPVGLRAYVEEFRPALWERQLAQAYFGLGQLAQSRIYVERALKRLGWPVPTHLAGQWWRMWQQGARRFKPYQFKTSQIISVVEAARAYEQLAHIAYFSQEKLLVYVSILHTLNLAEAVTARPEIARGLANWALGLGVLSLHRYARLYSGQARALAAQLEQPEVSAWVLMITATYDLGMGQWQALQTALTQAWQYCEQLKDRRHAAQILSLQAHAAYCQGQFVRSGQLYVDIEAAALLYGDNQAQAWGLVGQAFNLWRLGQVDDILPILHKALRLLTDKSDPAEIGRVYGLLTLVYWHLGDKAQAEATATQTAFLLDQTPVGVAKTIEAYACLTEFYLARWAHAGHTPQAATWRAKTQASLRQFYQVARVFPIARPRLMVYQGYAHWLMGRPRAAYQQWANSCQLAQQLDMPYEVALAQAAWGKHLPNGCAERNEYLYKACRSFTELAAIHDLTQTLRVWLG